MIKYCPICNRSSDKFRFVGEFCEVCVADKMKKNIPDRIEIERCKSCGRIRAKEGYIQLDNGTLREAVKRSLGTKCEVKIVKQKEKSAVVNFHCEADYGYADFDKEIMLNFRKIMCIDCYRKTSGYYEALVQLRGVQQKADKAMSKITRYVEKNGAFISRIDETEHGIDIYISDKEMMNHFFQLYKMKPKRSFTLHGVKNGRRIYRNVYLLRFDKELTAD